jgi:hypothetical protein
MSAAVILETADRIASMASATATAADRRNTQSIVTSKIPIALLSSSLVASESSSVIVYFEADTKKES